MPVWIQMTAAFSAGLISGVMGIALIPFLEKYRFHTPDGEPQQGETASGNRARPTMCGILLIFGCMAGLVLNYTLYLQLGNADRTSLDFQMQSRSLWVMLGYALLLGIGGWVLDYFMVKKIFLYEPPRPLEFSVIFLLACAMQRLLPEEHILDFGFFKWNAGELAVPFRALILAFCWLGMQGLDKETDGISITLGAVQLLCLTVLLIAEKQNLSALYSLTAAGACMGCFVWNLHPAKCRLGKTGSSWLGGVVPVLCLSYGRMDIFIIYMSVYLVNFIPVISQKKTLLALMSDQTPLQRTAVLTCFSLFCSALAVMSEHQ